MELFPSPEWEHEKQSWLDGIERHGNDGNDWKEGRLLYIMVVSNFNPVFSLTYFAIKSSKRKLNFVFKCWNTQEHLVSANNCLHSNLSFLQEEIKKFIHIEYQ